MWYDDTLIVKSLKKPRYAFKKLTRKFLHFYQDTYQFIEQEIRLQEKHSEEVINQNEIRVIGLRRSGNHAIIGWITDQGKDQGKVKSINDLPLNENPYRHDYEYSMDHYPEYPKMIESKRLLSLGNFEPLSYLIYNYEDHEISRIMSSIPERKHDLYLGKTNKRFDLLLLRDPFNLFASRIKGGFFTVKSHRKNFIDMWLSYAKEFVGETNKLVNKKVCVSYNQWICDDSYREQLANQLGLNFTDTGFDKVRTQGKGSSFDGTYKGSAQDLNLQERWKHYESDPIYQKIIRNQEVLEYSKQIFGVIPGTEQFYS
jgi:hypothetical protein